MTDEEASLHWLVRPTTIRKLWYVFGAVLLLVVAAQAVFYIKGYFGVDGRFGFGAVYGFVCCLLMVLVAKFLGIFLKRPARFYAEEDDKSESAATSPEHSDGA